jgi:hypothetical protein
VGGISTFSISEAQCVSKLHIQQLGQLFVSACNVLETIIIDETSSFLQMISIDECRKLHSITLPSALELNTTISLHHLPQLKTITPASPLGEQCFLHIGDKATLDNINLAQFVQQMNNLTLCINMELQPLTHSQSDAFGACHIVSITKSVLSSSTWFQTTQPKNQRPPKIVQLRECKCEPGFFSECLFKQSEAIILDHDTFMYAGVRAELLSHSAATITTTRSLKIKSKHVPQDFINQMRQLYPNMEVSVTPPGQ